MINLKSASLTIAAFAVLSFASTASAYTLTSTTNGINIDIGTETQIYNMTQGHEEDSLFGSSETATFFYKSGVKRFEDGKLDKAATAFRASLRAHGSKKMDKRTLHYLAYINQQQGNVAQAKAYAEAYMDLTTNKNLAK